MQNNVLLIYTGGTIGMSRNPKTGALEPFDFEQLLQNVPELKQFDTKISTYQFSPPIDSSDMSPRLWTDLAHVIADNYDLYDGFVVLHGTDTMSYTASALSYMLENLTKPVIFTGSQLPIGQLRTDGKENLITSIEIAATKNCDGHAMIPEVGIYFNGQPHHQAECRRVQRLRELQLPAFSRCRREYSLSREAHPTATMGQANDAPLPTGQQRHYLLAVSRCP